MGSKYCLLNFIRLVSVRIECIHQMNHHHTGDALIVYKQNLKICFSAHWMPYWCCRVYSFESLKHHHLEGCKLENPSSNPRLMAEWYRVYGTLEPQKRSGFQTPTGMQVKILPALCPWAWLGGCQRLVRSGLLLCFPKKKKNPSFKIQALKVGSRSDV